MRVAIIVLIIFFLSATRNYGQFLIPGEGIMDVKIGADWDEIEWELGFRGKKIDRINVIPALKFIAREADIDFDYVVSYQHIMWLPVSDLFFKNDKVCMIQLSSYPEYYKMLCVDIGTTEGLNFWDAADRVKEIYGSNTNSKNEKKSYFVFNDKGLGVELLENEVRSMFIFQHQMK
ncbi:MAG: hypothetical protein KAQ62_09200 [Cyclobacteriaceae bacterium]|nr:hypothetical protein [Cyclobacteriaceae bacterium]MCK5279621.1 hypothetical protein [Cyclobacteriaceae bacterium]MCK5368718.1 hypothetical protein [Cyclobacteriaceae bacterium]MCK5470255.1 hypothetical protein [Cyclobacteriaceae bacterium]MCK5703553.1 hypothetical protein [Cyclobacteriaceae bacterium]